MLVFPEMSFFLVSLLVLLLYKYTAIEASYGAILKLLYNSKDKISQYYNCWYKIQTCIFQSSCKNV